MNYKIRLANTSDCRLLFDWVNDPDVRKASFKSENIKWEDHENWFIEKIKNPNSYIFIFEVEDKQVGQIRFDKDEKLNEYILSYLISKEFRRKSLSSIIISEGLNFLRSLLKNSIKINAYVKLDNIPSIRAFKKNNFMKAIETENRIHFIKNL